MQILLIGDDTKCIDVPHEGSALSSRCNAELTPQVLTDMRFCVFDSRQESDLQPQRPDLAQQLEASAAAAMIFPYTSDDWVVTVRDMPARLQSLLPRLLSAGAIAIPTGELLNVLPFQDTEDPVQDALIRLIADEPGIRLQLSEIILDAKGAAWRFPELSPGMSPGASSVMRQHLSRFVPEALGPLVSVADSIALISGLFLMHDCLEQSHAHSQDVQGQGRNGDYWHAIMHRREPDFGNSRYWYRRVGRHPIFDDLPRRAADEFAATDDEQAVGWSDRICGGGEWNPFAWVDLCEEVARDKNSDLHEIARRIQWHEMLLLLRQTARDAYGVN